jgi:type III secretory pathway component EscR
VVQVGHHFLRLCLELSKLKSITSLAWLEPNITVLNVELIMGMFLMTVQVQMEKDFVAMVYV